MTLEQISTQESEPIAKGKNLDSDTYMAYLAAGPTRHANDLVDGIAVLGTAGEEKEYEEQGYDTLFREGDEGREGIIAYFNDRGVDTYNPKMKNWRKAHTDVEATACDEQSVLLVCLDIDEFSKSQEALNGGMATLTEINTRMAMAVLNGQRMVIAVRGEYEQKLTDPKAQLYYEYTMNNIRDFQKRYPDHIVLLKNEDREFRGAREAALNALEKQRRPETCLKPWTPKDLEQKVEQRDTRLQNLDVNNSGDFFVSSGTSNVGQDHRLARNQLVAILENGFNIKVKDLTTGVFAAPFEKHEQTQFNTARERMDSFIDCLIQEEGVTDKAAGVVWFVDDDEPSPIAQAKIAKFLFDILTENNVSRAGQLFIGIEEQFNVEKWTAKKFANPDQRKMLRTQFEQVIADVKNGVRRIDGNDDETIEANLEILVSSAEVIFTKLNTLAANQSIFKELKNHELLKVTPMVQHMVNMNRVRDIGFKQLQSFKKYFQQMKLEHGVELCILANNADEAINRIQVVQSPAALQERKRYFSRYKKVLDHLKSVPGGSEDTFVAAVQKAVLECDPEAAVSIQKGFDHLETKHLAGVKADLTSLLGSIGDTLHLSKRQQELLINFVGPLHDLLKLLGDFDSNMQAVPDHEEFVAYIVKQFGKKFGLSDEDVAFISELVGDHENIFKEKNRDGFISSKDPLLEGKAVFFVSDVLTNVFSFTEVDGQKSLVMKEAELKSRFEDLAFRHMDKIEGKVFRPEWIPFALTDVEAFLRHLSNHSIQVDPSILHKMTLAGLSAMSRAADRNEFTEYESYKMETVFTELLVLTEAQNRTELDEQKYQQILPALRKSMFNHNRLKLIAEKGYPAPDMTGRAFSDDETTTYLRKHLLDQGYVNRATRRLELG